MKFSIFTHAIHKIKGDSVYSYGPYVREINLWIQKFDEIRVLAPVTDAPPEPHDLSYVHKNLEVNRLSQLYFKGIFNCLKSSIRTIPLFIAIFREMAISDHIHIRCPGNVGLLASLVQLFFPKKKKTVKYAGNWDPKSSQPLSYRFQKWIVKNEFLSRNMEVLVYGDWKEHSKNIVPFFTASFPESDKIEISKTFNPPYKFVFVGSLTEGKRPLLTVKIIHALKTKGFPVKLDIYGEGEASNVVKDYIFNNELTATIKLHGNRNLEILKEAYGNAHFSILPSKSEGWPKALAEAMFFGCVPISTKISCIPWMLNNGKRGILIDPDAERASNQIAPYLVGEKELKQRSKDAMNWARQYTLESFEKALEKHL